MMMMMMMMMMIIKNVEAKVIPVIIIIGANGTIPKSLRQYLSNILGKHEIKELLGTAHIIRKLLM